MGVLRISAARRAGRSHRQSDVPCQDAFAVHSDPAGGRAVAAVADGLGSRPLSHFGSQAACDAAVASLAAEAEWDRAALLRAFEAARQAVRSAAAERGLAPDELATTLQIAALAGGKALAGMVGDGAVVGGDGMAKVLLAPRQAEYANEVVPITHSAWESDFRYMEHDGADALLLFTDGLTRVLLAKSRTEWTPFAPFFDAFLPQVRGPTFDDALVEKFLAADAVDKSWDDDKCLVVLAQPKPAAEDPRAGPG